MKKSVKIAIAVIIAVAAAVGGLVYVNLPADLAAVRLEPRAASEYFIEEGSVKQQESVSVYSFVSGRVETIGTAEGADVSAGDIICVVDSMDYRNGLDQALAALEGYAAQKDNLDEQRRQRADELNASRRDVVSQRRSVAAQESDYLRQTADATRSANDAIAKQNETVAAADAQIETQLSLQRILIAQSEATLETAEDNARDARILYDNGAIPKSEYDAVIKGRDDAEKALDAAVAQLDVIEAARITPTDLEDVKSYTEYYESAKAALDDKIAVIDAQLAADYTSSTRKYYDTLIAGQTASVAALRKNIADCSVAAPVSGKVSKLYVKDSNAVSAQSPIAVIETKRSSDIEVYVSTQDYADVAVGDKVEITQAASAGDIVFGGTVAEIDDKAVSRLSPLGVSENVVKVTVTPDSPENSALIPGFTFDVKFFTYYAEGRILVPKTAVFKYSADKAGDGVLWAGENLTGRTVEDLDMVYDVTDGTARMRQVLLGRELRSDYVVISGLEPGSAVIKDASDERARQGVKVRV
ncbi:MAG: biotin/lipoyl-binding protein [Clostridiales bacterium]|nr:biotin/lipoyl-binding protein [Clostridiales bacterium]